MDMKDDSGKSQRDSLMQVIETAPEGSDMYEAAMAQIEESPEIPFYLTHVWEWFWQIHEGRSYGMSGPNPLTWPDIKAWKDLLNIQIHSLEVGLIKVIDSAYLEYLANKHKLKSKAKKGK